MGILKIKGVGAARAALTSQPVMGTGIDSLQTNANGMCKQLLYFVALYL